MTTILNTSSIVDLRSASRFPECLLSNAERNFIYKIYRRVINLGRGRGYFLCRVDRNDESRRARGHSSRHSDAALTLPDAITRGRTWRAPECTQCLPYWLACSVLRNVINTSLTHAPNPVPIPATCNPSVTIVHGDFPSRLPPSNESARIYAPCRSEKHTDVLLDK